MSRRLFTVALATLVLTGFVLTGLPIHAQPKAPDAAPAPEAPEPAPTEEAPPAPAEPAPNEPAPNEPAPAPTAEQSARDAAIAEARVHYERGKELYAAGDHKLALIEFKRAYAIAPSYRILYNIGQVNMQLSNYARAMTSFRAYLAEGGDSIAPERRESVELELGLLKNRTAYISVNGNTPGAEVRVDGVPMGEIPLTRLLVDAGEHTVSVNEGGRDDSEYVTLAAQEHVTLTIDLPLPQTSPTLAPVFVPITKKQGVGTEVIVSWTITGALAATAIGTGVGALFAQRDLRNAKAELIYNEDEFDDLATRAQALSVSTDVLAGLAILGTGLSLYLTIVDGSDDEEGDDAPPAPAARLQMSPGYLGVTGSF